MPQSAYDVYQNSGLGTVSQRKVVQNNPDNLPMGFLPSDFGLLGWSVDPMDFSSNTQAIVSGTQYFVRLSNQCNLNSGNNNAVAKVGLYIGGTAAATPGAYSGLAVYSYVPGAANMTLLGSTGADDGAAWVTSGANKYFEAALTAAVGSSPGLLYGSFIATFTTTPTLPVSAVSVNTLNIKGKSLSQVLTLAAQTSFTASPAVAGMSAGTFCPMMGIAAS